MHTITIQRDILTKIYEEKFLPFYSHINCKIMDISKVLRRKILNQETETNTEITPQATTKDIEQKASAEPSPRQKNARSMRASLVQQLRKRVARQYDEQASNLDQAGSLIRMFREEQRQRNQRYQKRQNEKKLASRQLQISQASKNQRDLGSIEDQTTVEELRHAKKKA